MASQPVLRFAPSPNGRLHLGHALSALTGWQMAQRLGGRFLVRVEDIDPSRTRTEYIDGIFEDLAWLGIRWETPVLRQSEHMPVYVQAADRLREMGVLYPCFATRSEIAAAADREARDPEGAPLYPGLHKSLSAHEIAVRKGRGELHCLRIDMPKALALAREKLRDAPLSFTEIASDGTQQSFAAAPERWGDAVIVRKDVPASYHLAVVADDARQGISHVTRGQDLFAATDVHRLLQVLLDLPEPLYHHHRLLTGDDGRKLAKSQDDASLASLRAQGLTVVNVKRHMGWI